MKAVFLLLSLLAHHGYAKRLMIIDENTFLEHVQNGANNFSLNLFKTALKPEPGNFISSPFSAYMVLAMASYGAKGVTRKEFQEVLHLPKLKGVYAEGIAKSLKAINRKLMLLEPVFLSICNKIFASSKLSLNPQYQDILEDTFFSPPVKVYFGNPNQAAKIINSWIRVFTFGKIKNIISADELNRDMALMLVNAVYFYGQWKVPFDPKSTLPRPFHVNGKLTKNVPTMLHEGKFQIGMLPQMDATFVVLPYQDGGRQEDATYMYIILPKRRDGLSKIEENIDSLTLKDLHNTNEYEIELHVPKFKLESTSKLNDYLTQMGLRSAFSDGANFDEMILEHRNLMINGVVQKSFIAIDEKGAEAAAITGMDLENKIGPSTYQINRPFVILLATEEIILFAGRVMDPSV